MVVQFVLMNTLLHFRKFQEEQWMNVQIVSGDFVNEIFDCLVALKILDLDGDMMITQSEVTKVCLKIAKVCAKSGIRFSETVPATVNKIFNNGEDE